MYSLWYSRVSLDVVCSYWYVCARIPSVVGQDVGRIVRSVLAATSSFLSSCSLFVGV